jgi:hypothetical protein
VRRSVQACGGRAGGGGRRARTEAQRLASSARVDRGRKVGALLDRAHSRVAAVVVGGRVFREMCGEAAWWIAREGRAAEGVKMRRR